MSTTSRDSGSTSRQHWQPSARAVATRSLTAAMRLNGDARRQALRDHADLVWSGQVCSTRRMTF